MLLNKVENVNILKGELEKFVKIMRNRILTHKVNDT